MKNFTALLFIILFTLSICAQKPKRKPAARPAKSENAAPVVVDEKTEFEKAAAAANAADRIAALQKFAADFPDSAEKNNALEMIVAARAEVADEKMRAGNAADGIALFKSAVEDAPAQMSDKLFADVVLQIPSNLYFRGERAAAVELARAVEAKVEGNAKHTLALATFYLGTENGDQAKRLAEKTVSLDANLPAAYQTLGLANRLNFNLEDAASAYQKALELDADSVVSKRSLAEMKRALGKSDEAAALYREILDKNPSDALAESGLTLALFDAGKQSEAEGEMQKALEQNPNNLTVLVGAAYVYAARGDADRAVELARKAVSIEPRYVWAYVALARGYLRQNRFYDAESALLAARAYGNFPTLDYELATVRAAAGFYREAAQALAKSFAVKDDFVAVRLGGRVERQAKTFIELIAPERRASIFEPLAADDPQNADRLKSLLDFYQKLESTEAVSSAEIADAADKFIGGEGDPKMKLHRRLFAVDYLLKKKADAQKILELIKPAPAEVEAALNVPNASAAVLADELYASRAAAIARSQLVVVPEVQRQTLSGVLRGRIEEITGAALLAENKPSEAVVRFKRGLSVLPEKSAWWRSTEWRLGAALDADGKSSEALAAYIKSYISGVDAASDAERRAVIEAVYLKVNGTLDGLDAKIGAKSATVETASSSAQAPPQKSETEIQPAQNQTANAETATAAAPKTEETAPPHHLSEAETR